MNYVEGNGFFRYTIDYKLSSEFLPDMYFNALSLNQQNAKYID